MAMMIKPRAPMMTATMQKTMKPRASLTRHERPDVTMLLEHLTHFFQQFDAVCALIRRIIVRKMASDVPQCCSTEKRIHNGMDQHIRIGMSQKAIFIRDFHTTQNQFPVFHQFMHIVTHSYSHCSFLRFVTF